MLIIPRIDEHGGIIPFRTLGKGYGVLNGVKVGDGWMAGDQHKGGELQGVNTGGVSMNRRVNKN